MNVISNDNLTVDSEPASASPSTRMILLLIVLSILMIAMTARGHQVETITSFAVTNYTGLVIDSDAQWALPEYNREDILARAVIQFSTTNNFQTAYNYQVTFRLLDGANPVLLKMTNGTTSTNLVLENTQILPNIFTTSKTNIGTYVGALRPAVRLDPYKQYTVDVRLLERTNGVGSFAYTGDTAVDGPRYYRHFTSTNSNDAETNVIAFVTTAPFSKNYAVKTIAGKDAFACGVSLAFLRYDRYFTGYVNPPADDIAVSLSYELRESVTGAAIPLVSTTTNFVVPVPRYAKTASGFQIPAVVNNQQTIHLKPLNSVQLDPLKFYYAVVHVRHLEKAGEPMVDGNSVTNLANRLLHFNGDLYFGSIQTRFTSIDNTPGPAFILANGVQTWLGVDNQSGYVVGAPNHTYGDGTDLSVMLRADGNAYYLGSNPVEITEPSPDTNTINHIRFNRLNVRFDTNGALASFAVWYPTGFGTRSGAVDAPNRMLVGPLASFADLRVGQSLTPLNNPTATITGWGAEETKPFWFKFTSMTWDVANGRFLFTPTGEIQYTRAAELAALAAAPVSLSFKIKPSNERHMASVDEVLSSPVIIAADSQKDSARMSIDVKMTAGNAVAHFPHNAVMIWSNATTMTISNDLVGVGGSQFNDANPVVVRYTRDCTEPDCNGGQGESSLRFQAANDTLYLTKDGGLTAKGIITQPEDLTWGWIGLPAVQRYAHRVQAFTEAGFHMPGFFLRGDQTTHGAVNRPAVLLYTGIGTNSSTQVDFTRVERPYNPAYSDDFAGGFGDYAGLNFRVGDDGNREADSTLAAQPTGYYPLTGRSKYYLRKGGISGIHEAVFGSFPPTNNWYGYAFQVSNFGLAFLDSQNVDSRTEGSVFVKSPSVVTQAFEELTFTCIGGLDDAKVPSGEKNLNKVLDYWQADFTTLAVRFDRDETLDCDPGKGKLVLGVKAYAQPFPDALLFGELGFETNGNLISYVNSDVLPNFGSRLKLPSNLSFPGPSGEKWRFTPVGDAYFNNHDYSKNDNSAGGVGWLNIAGKLDAPFYEDLQVHMHCSADKDGSDALIYLMGGWGSPNRGYEWQPGKNFFNQSPSDKDNAAFPSGVANIKQYRDGNSANGQWEVRAKRLWLEVVDFDYPLFWDKVPRAFRSAKEESDKLLVLEVKHQIDYLSPKNANISFGAQYTGIPKLNIANLAYDAMGGMKNAVDGVVDDVLDAGLEKLEETLSSQAVELFQPAFDSVLRPRVKQLVEEMRFDYANQAWNDVNGAASFLNNAISGNANSLFNRIKDQLAVPTIPGADGLAKTINGNLDQVLGALNEVERILQKDPGTEVRNVVQQLMTAIVGEVAGQFAGYFVPGEVNEVLKQLNPTLDQLLSATQTLRGSIQQVKDALAAGQEFQQQLTSTLNSQVAPITDLLNKAQKDMNDILKQFDFTQIDNPFAHYTDKELTDLFMQKLEDRIFGSIVVSKIRETIKHRLYDLDASIRQTVDSAFQQVNVAIRDIVSEAAQELSSEITPMLDDISAVAGAGKMNGYAHISGDDLKELRIDAYAQLKVPSEMEFHGFLLIRELNSENFPAGCLDGGKATEVTLGADNIPVKFAQTDARLAAQAKITLADGNAKLLGIAGGIDLDGKIVLGPVNIKKLSAALAFGKEENYFSAAARVAVNSYEGFGGIFFGRTCTLEPFSWDPQVKKILGEPPFTGAYGYVEVMIPVSEALLGIPATCMFQVSAGVGMGAGFFIEGPTFVAKSKLAVSGDFLCVASIYGDIILAGKKGADGIRMLGSGTFEVELCALICISASKTVEMQYNNGSWDIDF